MSSTLRRLVPVALLLLAATIGISLLVAHQASANRAARAATSERTGLHSFQRMVQDVLVHEEQVADTVGMLDGHVGGKRWGQLAQIILDDRAAHGAGWVTALSAGDRRTFERQIGRSIYIEPRPGVIRRAPAAARYAVVTAAASSQKGQHAAVGLDLAANPLRARLLARSLRTHLPQASPPVSFLANPAWRGTVLYDPAFTASGHLLGWVTSSYTAGTLAGAVDSQAAGGLTIRATDAGQILVPGHGAGHGIAETIRVGGRRWQVTAWSDRQAPSLMPWLTLVLGLLITGIVVAILRVALGRERVALSEARTHRDAESQRREELEAARAQAQAFFENVPAAFSMRDLEGRYVMVNDKTVEWTGIPRDMLLGTGHGDYPEWGIAEAVKQADHAVLSTRAPVDQELAFPGAAGEPMDIRTVQFPVPGPDGALSFIGSLSLDLTKEKAVSRELADSRELLAEVFDGAPTGQAVLALDGSWIRVNRALLQISGYTEEELFSAPFQAITHPEDVDLDMDLAREMLAGTRERYQVEKRYIHKLGFTLLMQLAVSIVREPDGTPRYFVCQLQDITARRALQMTIADSDARMRALVENAPAAITVRDLQGRFLYLNSRAADALGSSPEDLRGKLATDRRDPDRARAIELEDAELLAHGEPIDFRLPMVHADGTTHFYDVTKYAIRDDSGIVIGLGSFSVDITDRLAALAELEARERELIKAREHAETILSSMGEGYCLTVNGQIVAVNEALCEMTGYSEAELLSDRPASYLWTEQDDARMRTLRKDLIEAGGGSFELQLRRKDGTSFEASINARSAQVSGSGGFVSTIRDITEHKQHEREQDALGKVARLVAEKAEPAAVFEQVTDSMLELFGSGCASLARFDAGEGEIEYLRAITDEGENLAGLRLSLGGDSASALVYRSGRVARVLRGGAEDAVTEIMDSIGITDSIAAPIHVAGKLWGTAGLSFSSRQIPANAEERLGRFAELAGLAIANTEAWNALSQRAASDPMTGLANHGTFHDRLRAEVGRARRYGRHLSLVLLDLDHFKSINDTYGHQVGDEVLTQIAAMLADVVRDGEIVGRIGGEEFAWLMPETDRDGAYQAAERLRRTIEASTFAKVGRITLSAGVCSSEFGRDAEQLMRYADRALYWAKDSGRNTTFLYTPEAHSLLSRESNSAHRQHAMASVRALARAIDSKDPSTRQHSDRVAGLVERIALQIGWDSARAQQLYACGLLHDVGKIGIPDEILLKPGRLTPDEYEQVKRHAEMSALIASEVLEAEQVAWIRSHHERWDGDGYPDRLSGSQIPDGGQILAVADAFDVMTQSRTYKPARTIEDAREELQRECGRQFAPEVVGALLAVIERAALETSPT